MPQFQPIMATETTQWMPVKRNGNVCVYQNSHVQPIPALRKTLTISLAEPSKTSKLYKARVRIVIPVEKMDRSISPAVGTGEVDYLVSSDLTFTYDARSSNAARAALNQDFVEFMTQPEVSNEVLVSLNPLF